MALGALSRVLRRNDRVRTGEAKGGAGFRRPHRGREGRLSSRTPAGTSHAEAASLPMNGLTARLPLGLLKLSPGRLSTAMLARRGLRDKMADDDLVCPQPVSARNHPARRLARCAFHAQLYRDVEDLLAERGLDVSCETVRRWVWKLGPENFAFDALGQRRNGVSMRWP
jgi:hypothetical protein